MKITYYGAIDLKLLRKNQGLTVDQLADRVYCSPRTINRLEVSNRTSNRDLAEKLATVFSYPFDQLFIPINQRFLESIASHFPPIPLSAPLPGKTYYLLYFRRVSWWDANL